MTRLLVDLSSGSGQFGDPMSVDQSTAVNRFRVPPLKSLRRSNPIDRLACPHALTGRNMSLDFLRFVLAEPATLGGWQPNASGTLRGRS